MWDTLVLDVPERLADEVAGGIALGGLGAECAPSERGTTRIRVVLRSPEAARAAERRARRLLASLGLEPAACGLAVERLDDEPWVERFYASLAPMPLGRRFLVDPGEVAAPPEGRVRIALRPGRAFGTGEHPTTRLCAERLEDHVATGQRWLDLGCGTAILSIVASVLGAREVLALDHDPDVIEVAREILAANGAPPGVTVRQGSIEDAPPGRFDGIVANIHAPFFLERAEILASRLAPGGILVASGFLREDLGEIGPALASAGLDEAEIADREPWVAWVGRSGPR
jgi:ribosomal protein L11 methyltransferase